MMDSRKRKISGPGAADFLAAQGGEDIPGASGSKGATEVDKDAPLTDAKNLEPDLAIDTNTGTSHKERGVPRGRDEG